MLEIIREDKKTTFAVMNPNEKAVYITINKPLEAKRIEEITLVPSDRYR